jgi:hypothetical protein
VYESHAEAVVEFDVLLVTVRLSVAIESQPDTFVNVAVYIPLAESDCVFQLYGVADEQILNVVELVEDTQAFKSPVIAKSLSVVLTASKR